MKTPTSLCSTPLVLTGWSTARNLKADTWASPLKVLLTGAGVGLRICIVNQEPQDHP